MKRFVCIITIVLLLLSLASCSSSADSDSTSEYQAYIDSISDSLSGKVPLSSVSVSEDNGLFSVDVSISSYGEVSNFGNYVLMSGPFLKKNSLKVTEVLIV